MPPPASRAWRRHNRLRAYLFRQHANVARNSYVWVREDSCARVRHVSCRLLQHCLGWFTEDRDGQAPVFPKCRSPRRQPNKEVQPRPDTFTSHRVALAGRPWAGPVQARSDCSPMHCMRRKASQYLVDCCTSSSDIASRQRLRSASRHQLDVPWHYRS